MFQKSYRSFTKLLLISAIACAAGAQYVQQGGRLVVNGSTLPISFGFRVALSADGNTALIGGPGAAGIDGGIWVFTFRHGVWSQQKLAGKEFLGALSADGNMALLSNGAVFIRNHGVWSQQASLTVPAPRGEGYPALSSDGNTALLGVTGIGAFVFTRSGDVWTQMEELTVTSANYSGVASLSATGNTALLGNFVFDRNGVVWQWKNTFSGADDTSVALSGDGRTALFAGTPGGNPVASVFARPYYDIWTESQLVAHGANNIVMPSRAVALSGDGLTAVVGGAGENGGAGAVWVFKSTFGAGWSQLGNILTGSDATAAAGQGISVAVSAGGKRILFGGPFDNTSGGAAWMFVMFQSRDFDLDGFSDTMLYDPILGQSYIALSNGNGTFDYVPNLVSPGFDTLRAGNFKAAKAADIILYNSQTASAYIGLGKGDGTFNFQPVFWSPGYDEVETGDIDGDGKTDVALYNSSTGTLYTGISNGVGDFTYRYTLISRGYTLVRLSDFTGDGKADLFLYNAATGQANLGVGDGTGAFSFHPLFISPGYTLGDVGDLDHDGKMDIILYNSSNGNAATGVSDGAGGFMFMPYLFSPGFTSVRLGNFAGDNIADVTLYNKNNGVAYFGINYRHWICLDIPFPPACQSHTFLFSPLFWSPGYDYVELMDVDGDGKSDVVLYNSSTGTEYTGISGAVPGTFQYTYSYWGTRKILAR